MKEIFRKTKHIHFVGIGGIGMSGMAELLLNHGFKITGSDIMKSERTNHLSKIGINISYNHNEKNINNCDVIVYSSAIDINNKEILCGNKKDIPIIKRSELLGELIKIKNISIGVSGTHGKTTTSSMLGSILYESNQDPTLVIGGIVNKFKSNNISGEGDIIVVEADEFDKSFLSLKPTYSIVNNLDLEHLDCYDNLEDLKSAFTNYANAVPFYGKVAINNDSVYLNQIINQINRPKITFGIKNKSDINAKITSYNKNKSTFEIKSKLYENFTINLNYPGEHNIYNALAATTIALELGISNNKISYALENYLGVKRRFETKYNNNKNNIIVIDDYAHHPIEIEFTIKAARKGWNNRIISIFEPHLYSRTKDFHKEFSNSLALSDYLIITDIYGAREKPLKGVTSNLIIEDLRKINYKNCTYIKNKNEIPHFLNTMIKNNDMVLCMGAGQINTIIEDIISLTENKYE